MRSLSVLTPYFREEVAYSIQALEAAGEDNTTLLLILRALHPDEWANLCERVELQGMDTFAGAGNAQGESHGRSSQYGESGEMGGKETCVFGWNVL